MDGSMPTEASERPFMLNSWDGRRVDRRQIGIDDPGLRMGKGAQSLAKQPLGCIDIA